jgi:hypothetical protein
VAHHNGVLQIFDAADGGSRVVWTADVLPHALSESFGPMMGQGLEAMKRRLEASSAST